MSYSLNLQKFEHLVFPPFQVISSTTGIGIEIDMYVFQHSNYMVDIIIMSQKRLNLFIYILIDINCQLSISREIFPMMKTSFSCWKKISKPSVIKYKMLFFNFFCKYVEFIIFGANLWVQKCFENYTFCCVCIQKPEPFVQREDAELGLSCPL